MKEHDVLPIKGWSTFNSKPWFFRCEATLELILAVSRALLHSESNAGILSCASSYQSALSLCLPFLLLVTAVTLGCDSNDQENTNYAGSSGDSAGTADESGSVMLGAAPVFGDDCIVTMYSRRGPSSNDFDYVYTRIRYEESTRIKTREVSASPDFSTIASKRIWRYDEVGHVVAWISPGKFPMRDDYQFDTNGNEIFRSSNYHADELDPNLAPSPPYDDSSEARHSYDSSGRLISTEVTRRDHQYGGTNQTTYSYSVDDLGRCKEIVTTRFGSGATDNKYSTKEIRSYQNDVWIRSEETCRGSSDGTAANIGVTSLKFDQQGRVLALEVDGCGHWMSNADGNPDIINTYRYEPDGSISSTHLDFTDDVFNDKIERDGRLTSVRRSDYIIPPKCVELAEKLPKLSGYACRYPPQPLRYGPWEQ